MQRRTVVPCRRSGLYRNVGT